MIKKLYLLLFLFILSIGQGWSQGTIRGNVYDKESGEPIIYGTVQLAGTTMGANTDLDGFFSIAGVEPGDYRLIMTYIGYDSISMDIKVVDNSITYKSIYLTSSGVQLATVQVSAEKQTATTEVKVSSVTVTPRQIRSLPSTGGEPDLAQYLPVIPGVIFTGDQGGQLYIRGGSPIQNRILLDGMTIYNPFHSIGFFSVFETEAIRSVDVLTGGFNADHGGRISAIVDIKTREGNKKRLAGVASVNPFQSKLLLEGPIKKLKEGGGSTSFLLTGKHSYINETSKILYPYAVDTSLFNVGADTSLAAEDLGLPFSFSDLYGKLSFVFANGSKLNLFGFNFNDKVDYTGFAEIGWKNTGVGADFTLIPSTSNMIIGGQFTFSNYNVELIEQDGNPRTSSIDNFSVGLDFTYFGANSSEVNYGFIIDGINTDFAFTNFLGLDFQQESFTTELAAFAKFKYKFDDLIIEPGLRLQYYASQSQFRLEPRIGLKYNATKNLRFKAAAGTYSQNLISTVNERDVVNLFVGFLTGPEEEIFKPGTTDPVDNRLQTAYHAIFGVEYDVNDITTINVEPYYKGFTQLININRNKIEPTDPDYSAETGEAYGIDFSLKRETEDLYVWLTYSLGYVRRDDGEQVYPTIFDRRHNINTLLTYNFGEGNVWEASGRWNFGTGFPFTQTQGFYELLTLDQSISTDVLSENGDLSIIYSDVRNGGRLPVYHRFDVSLKRTFNFTKYTKLEAVASVTNVYNRENIFYVDRITGNRVDQLPILPSFGLILNF